MKIVIFNNGKYGIRKWSLLHFGYVFLDLQNGRDWWRIGSRWMDECQSDLKTVERIYDLVTDKGLIVR